MLAGVTRRNAILAVAVGLVAAIAATWWLSRDRAPTPTAGADPSHAAPGADPSGRVHPGRGSDAVEVDTTPLVADDPRGTLRLEGQVVEGADMHAVANATVTIDSHPQRTATSDAGGNFAFDALVGRPYTLVAHAASGVAGPVTARLTATSEPVVLHLRAAATLAVTVTGPGGTGVSNATVELRGVDSQRATADGSGAATFASVIPGTYQLVGWADGLAHAYLRVTIGNGANQARLALVRGAAIAGIVVDERGQPIASVRVAYSAAGEYGGGFAARRVDAATTGSDGGFRFDAVPAGTMRLEASHPSYASAVSAPVTVDGVHERDGITIKMSDGAIVRGRVVDGMHQPVVAARVRIGDAGGQGRGGFGMIGAGTGGPPREAYSDDDGAFEIRGLPKRALVAVALHDTGASRDVPVDASGGDVSGVELVLDVTGTISGVVLDPTGAPVEGVQVSARPSFDGGSNAASGFAAFRLRGLPQELSDGGGKFTLRGLLAGNYQLVAVRPRASRGRRGGDDAVLAKTGDTDVKIVLQPEGSVKGTVAIVGGGPPSLFTVVIGPVQQSFPSGGAFEVDDIPPGNYQLEVRGPEFQTKAVAVEIDPGKVADVGAISVVPGRTLSGIVIASGQPVANASVYAGHMLLAFGTANAQSPMASLFNAAVKQTETGSDGTFALSGFDQGDLSIVAERTDIGRSTPQLVTEEGSNGNALVLTIVAYGSLSGTISQAGQPAPGILVTCQSVGTPGVVYTAPSAADGTYAFDQLAADTYKVSATLRNGRRGMQFYSQQAAVPAGGSASVNLTADAGQITLDVAVTARSGTLGGGMAWLASATIAPANGRDLLAQVAALGTSNSQMQFLRGSQGVTFVDVWSGAYTMCLVPFPQGLRGGAAMTYMQQHAAQLPAFCQAATVAATPTTQNLAMQVDVPPMLGSGAGSGGP
jgi:hypothetical protein